MTVPILMGAEWFLEPMEQPADRHTLQQYDVDPQVVERWRVARMIYLRARAVLLRELERQGFRAPARPRTGHVDIVFDRPPGPERPGFVDVEDDQRRSIQYGEWVERDDGTWALRVPAR